MTANNTAKALLNAGLRPTVQRLAVYTYLKENPTHPTADIIYKALLPDYPTFSRTTVYNTLHALVAAGIVRTVSIDSEKLRYDGNSADHAHFKCLNCKKIYDLPFNDAKVSKICPERFILHKTDVFISGICENCR